jgi:chemotaxis protein MotA
MIRHVLRTEINSMKARHFNVQDVFKKMATFAPAFGMLGTLIGLIQMLSKLDDPATIGPSMAVALLTTFYGSLLATVIFIPIAGKLKSRTMFEVINLEIIFEGAICILKDNNQLSVYEKLSSFLPQAQRPSMRANTKKKRSK